jgi:VIT1/CCC1 family predicted Fe2+/Mn2+ transporter
MLLDSIAQVGLATSALAASATSIGAGVVVGGFLAATGAMLGKRSRREVEDTALRDGYIGGVCGMLCLLLDLLTR